MSEQINYWNLIINQYIASELSQPAFCKQNGLSLNQFQYRWAQYNLSKRVKSKPHILEANAVASSFESITITPLDSSLKEKTSNIAELAIHLPNRIRCDVKMDLCTDSFTTLLTQLVALC